MFFRIRFFFYDTAASEIYTLSLHDALPISRVADGGDRAHHKLGVDRQLAVLHVPTADGLHVVHHPLGVHAFRAARSEEHTSELQSRQYLVCRLLLEKKM